MFDLGTRWTHVKLFPVVSFQCDCCGEWLSLSSGQVYTEWNVDATYVAYMPAGGRNVTVYVRFGPMDNDSSPAKRYEARLRGKKVLVSEVKSGTKGAERELVDAFSTGNDDQDEAIDFILRVDPYLIASLVSGQMKADRENTRPGNTQDSAVPAIGEATSTPELLSDAGAGKQKGGAGRTDASAYPGSYPFSALPSTRWGPCRGATRGPSPGRRPRPRGEGGSSSTAPSGGTRGRKTRKNSRRTARRVPRDWLARARASGIRVLVQFADTLEEHQQGILAYYDYPMSTGPLEGTNTKIQLMKRQAYGFRDLEFFKLKILGLHETKRALVG